MMQPDDPPFLTVGTEVSAKYKGAFCEAKVNKVVKNVKVKVTFKFGQGSNVVTDDNVKGVLKVGAQVKAFHNDKNQYLDALVNKIQDCSQYTVVFDDGDITTLRRNSLCLKSGRHFAESETLDQLPLTHPEHFGTPVVGGRRGRRSRPNQDRESGDESSSEDEAFYKKKRAERCQWEGDIGKVVCVETGEKKKQKDNWFPGLVVAPTAQDTVKIDTKKDFLVRSFQDGRYYTVPKKEAQMFSHENASRISQGVLRTAVDKALEFIDSGLLPPHWDRDILLGHDISEAASDKSSLSNTSDDETREEKDHFVAQLYKYMEECNTPLNKEPMIGQHDLDLYKLYKVVTKQGGFNRVMNQNQWKVVANKMGFQHMGSQAANLTKAAYKKYLKTFEGFYRKLGCTMVSSPRGSRMRHRSGRSLIRDRDRTPRQNKKDTESCESTEEEPDKKPVEIVPVPLEPEKKEEPRASRSQTPSGASVSAPPKEMKLKSLKSTDGRRVPKKEPQDMPTKTPKVIKIEKKTESDSEEDSTTYSTRSLRNREEIKEESGRRGIKRVREHQRSASSTSTSSVTSSSSSSKDVDWAKGPDKRLKTRASSLVSVSKSAKTEEKPPQPLPVTEEPKVVKEETAKASTPAPPPPPMDIHAKKTRKKTADSRQDQSKFLLPRSTPIDLGDKLSVLYGPNSKGSTMEYEAKVLKVDESNEVYYVHYLGWNTRYDEWVDRTRIADNLTPKSKRATSSSLKRAKKYHKTLAKDSWAFSGGRGHGLRARSLSHASKDTQPLSPKGKEGPRLPSRRLSTSRDTTDSEGAVSAPESCSEHGTSEFNSEKASDPPAESEKEPVVDQVPGKKPVSCGKDIDLKAIESEMKGLDKLVKKSPTEACDRIMTTVIPGSLTIVEKKSNDPRRPNDGTLKKVEIPVRLVPAHEVMGQIKPVPVTIKESSTLDDDIYEFREPEPFDLCEIRSRKDPKPLLEDEDADALPPPSHSPRTSPQDDSDTEFSVKKEAKDYTRKSEAKPRPCLLTTDLKSIKVEQAETLRGSSSTANITCDMEGGLHTAQIHSPKHCLPSPDYSHCSLNDPAPLVVEHSPPIKTEPVAIPCDPPQLSLKSGNTASTFTAQNEGRRLPKTSEASHVKSSPIKKEEKCEAKVMPFAQRQHHIFPHLLSRPDLADDKKDPPKHSLYTSTMAPSTLQGPDKSVASEPKTLSELQSSGEGQSGKCEETPPTKSIEKTKCEASVEESIEAVVQRFSQELNADKKPTPSRLGEKRRKNVGRHKKLSRDIVHPPSSEDSDCNSALEEPPSRPKRIKSLEGSKHSPKRLQRISTDAEKKLAQQCEDEERANDADEEDNESTVPPTRSPAKEPLRRRKPFHHDSSQDESPPSKYPHKRRRSTLRHTDESEETGLGDLLCEETFLPGSPMTQELPCELTATKQEMPFASVPTGSGFSNRTDSFNPIVPLLTEGPPTSVSASGPSCVLSDRSAQAPIPSKSKPLSVFNAPLLHDRPSLPRSLVQSVVNMDHTPPSTPESSSTNTSDSPLRDDHIGKHDDTSKSGHYSSEMDFDNKTDVLSEGDSNTMDASIKNSYPRNVAGTRSQLSEDWDTEEGSCESSRPSKIRKLSPKSNGEEKSAEHAPSFVSPTPKRKPQNSSNVSEDGDVQGMGYPGVVHNPKIFMICPELKVEMDPEERIAVLENYMKELKKSYKQRKAELASIERRRKKVRRKEKEKEAARRQES